MSAPPAAGHPSGHARMRSMKHLANRFLTNIPKPGTMLTSHAKGTQTFPPAAANGKAQGAEWSPSAAVSRTSPPRYTPLEERKVRTRGIVNQLNSQFSSGILRHISMRLSAHIRRRRGGGVRLLRFHRAYYRAHLMTVAYEEGGLSLIHI